MNRNRKLESVLNGWPWAYTGSLAMKIHANRLGRGGNMRRVGNINLAVHPNAFPSISGPITSTKNWNFSGGFPGPKSKRMQMIRMSNRAHMNVLKANGELAPRMNKVQRVNGIPVMSINSLLNQKKNINRNDVFGNNLRKLNANIAFLKELKNIERNMNSRAQRGTGASRV
jgi:hypothetical protein